MNKIIQILTVSFLLTNSIHAQLLYNNGATLQINTGATVEVKGDFTNMAASSLRNNGTLELKGNLTNNQVMSGYFAGTLILSGTSPQTHSGTSPFLTTQLQINNTVNNNNMLRVNGECKFINGIFNASSSTSPLLFSTNGFVSGSFPANNNSHVNGYVYREGIGAFTYPVGDGLAYQPVIVNLSSNPNGIKVKYNGTNAGSGSFSSSGTESTPLTSYNTLENWEISPSTVATGSVTVFWDAYKNTPVPDVSLAKVAHKFFTQWLNEGTTATGLPTAGSVTSNSITTWGNFTLGAISPVCTTPVVQATASNSTICSGTSTTLTASGATSYTWQPGGFTGASINVSPLSTTTYTVTGTVTGGCSATAIQTIQVNTCNSVLNLKAFIEGYYDGGGMMKPVLMNQGVAGASASQTDTITVELHSFSFPLFTASSVKTILNTNGTATCSFPVSGNYYLAVKHRNGLQTWSSNYITMGPTPVNYDFTTAANQAFNSNQTEVSPGVFAFYSGDVNADENLDLLDVSILENDINQFAFGHQNADLNGDGNVDLLDLPMLEANSNNFIFSQHP